MFVEAPRDLLQHIYISESFYNKKKLELTKLEMPYEIVADAVFKSISDTVTPQGILCIVKQMVYTRQQILAAEHPCYMILEDIQDPGNLGTILRTAEAAGVSAVIMSKGCVDIYNPKTVRSTMGSVYRVPFLYEEDLCGLLQEMKERNIAIYASHLQGSADYDKMSYIEGTAFLMGNESSGLSEELCQEAAHRIRIPMEGEVESLNVAVASSILMYEVCRQRR